MVENHYEYSGIAEATRDVRTKISESELINHPLSSPAFSIVVSEWTEALSGFQANVTITSREAASIEQVEKLYVSQEDWLMNTANEFDIGRINELAPKKVLFMGLFRDLQIRYASKQNLNPHKLSVLLSQKYAVSN